MAKGYAPVHIRTAVELGHIAADLYGAGPETFLLLHGIPGGRGTWEQVASELAEQAAVVVPDLLGFGRSDEASSFIHAEGHAASLIALVGVLGLNAVHLVGFDFGGPIACTMARLAPNRVKTLTLISTNVFSDTPIPGPLKIARIPGLGELAFRLMMGKWGLSFIWWPAVRNKRAYPWAHFRSHLQQPGVTSTRRIFLQSLRRLRELYAPIERGLPHVAVPCTVIWGDRDPFFPVSVGKRTAAAITTATYVEIPDCGHFAPEEYPQAVVRELRAVAARSGPEPFR